MENAHQYGTPIINEVKSSARRFDKKTLIKSALY